MRWYRWGRLSGIVAVAPSHSAARPSPTPTSRAPTHRHEPRAGKPNRTAWHRAATATPTRASRCARTELLTGDTAAKVTAAAEAKEPGATIERVETDSDGVYEAHMVRADGTHIVVQIDASFAVTNVQEGGAGGPAGGHGGPGMGTGKGQGGGGASGETPSSGTTASASTSMSAT